MDLDRAGRGTARHGSVTRRSFVRGGVSALLAPAVLNCDLSSTESNQPDGPRLTARPGPPTESPPIGLTPLGIGGSRDGVLYVPTSYSPDAPAPLLVALHGAGGTAGNWTSYHARAENRGMVLVIPDSRSSTWDLIVTGYGPDVTFLNQALEATFARVAVDPEKIALGGFSDGASYALSLGVSNGDLFSHLIGYSPGFFQPAQPVVGTPAVYVSHGTTDGVLSFPRTRDTIVPTLRDAGYDVRFDEFNGGHAVPADITEAALDWFAGAAG